MAFSSSNKPRCATCGKNIGTFTCRGCSQDFCLSHAQEHRQLLGKKMDEDVILIHDQLQQCLNQQVKQPSLHPLMKEINEWEKQSIEKIQLVAQNTRQKFLDIISKHTNNAKIALISIKEQLSRARDEDDFFEADINEWKEKLEKLKTDLNTPKAITIKLDDNMNSFIPKISISEGPMIIETFEKILGDIDIQDKGRLITHGSSKGYALVRSKGEYSSGQHLFCFTIENIGTGNWILFSIVSKNAPITEMSYSTPTTYGWAGINQVYLNGTCSNGFNGYKTNMETNHTLEFMIDCDKQKLRLRNEQTQSMYELDIDISKCPFPWYIILNLYHPGTRLRFLQ
ncbi:unnamed protein product [Rotaria magnacalcarata]|uniref:B box-type domain-containing protein n=1 Tax=Rotaria magnacalcarata TaxID=392030 RepID=A0A815YHU1_9BILA|nr:unnamed protein product [Rotaria magnacalcarata]CAF4215928.1 unnamed protein product [Rotaria magnacalcarata]